MLSDQFHSMKHSSPYSTTTASTTTASKTTARPSGLAPLRQILGIVLLLMFTCSDCRATTILVLGDSLSAAYGIDADKGWVALMARQLGPHYAVLNASISGETTQGGLARLPALLEKHQPDWLLLELGANDGLRGQSLQQMRVNLQQMIDLSQQAKAQVLLIGNHIPPNYGRIYTERFFQSYAELATKNKLALVPFMLAGIATKPALMQADGLHPNAAAQSDLLANISAVLYPLLPDSNAEENNNDGVRERQPEKQQ